MRPARPDEAELLFQIYASTREEELAAVPWAACVKESFLRMQFGVQDGHFRAIFPKASYDLIVSGDEVLGLLYVDRAAQAWLVIHIALLPQHRGKGLGTRLLTEVLSEAAAAGKPVRLQVERFNQAQRLYARLGFRQISDDGVYLLLECRPSTPYPSLTPNALRLTRHSAVHVDFGRYRARSAAFRPPLRHQHDAGRYQLETAEGQVGELVGIA